MQVQPYLFFDGRCDEAIEFYRRVLGAEVTALMRFKEGPEPTGEGGCQPRPEDLDKVMHAELRIGETTVMVSDGQCTGRPEFRGVSLTIAVAEPAEAENIFAALAEGGQVQMPMGETFFTSHFGMVADRFGVSWMVLVASNEPTRGGAEEAVSTEA